MISSVSRALAILQFLASREDGVLASEIAAATGTEKSAVSRILATLEEEKYVVRSEANQYFVGLKLVSMGILQLEIASLLRLCLPSLRTIANYSGELVQLAVAESDGLHYVAKADGKERVRVQPRLGSRAVLHATAVGKVWLASLPEELALRLAVTAGLEPLTKNTITTVTQLRDELAQVRRAGFALNHQETFAGVNGIAVPIRGQDESIVVGALLIVAPAFRMDDERAMSFLPLLKTQAEELRGIEYLRRHGGLTPASQLESLEVG